MQNSLTVFRFGFLLISIWINFHDSIYVVIDSTGEFMQRGHQNSLELMPTFCTLMILGGMRHPCASAVLGLLYTVTRFFYFKGYATGDPEKRLSIGKYGFLALLGLMVSTFSFGVSLLLWSMCLLLSETTGAWFCILGVEWVTSCVRI